MLLHCIYYKNLYLIFNLHTDHLATLYPLHSAHLTNWEHEFLSWAVRWIYMAGGRPCTNIIMITHEECMVHALVMRGARVGNEWVTRCQDFTYGVSRVDNKWFEKDWISLEKDDHAWSWVVHARSCVITNGSCMIMHDHAVDAWLMHDRAWSCVIMHQGPIWRSKENVEGVAYEVCWCWRFINWIHVVDQLHMYYPTYLPQVSNP